MVCALDFDNVHLSKLSGGDADVSVESMLFSGRHCATITRYTRQSRRIVNRSIAGLKDELALLRADAVRARRIGQVHVCDPDDFGKGRQRRNSLHGGRELKPIRGKRVRLVAGDRNERRLVGLPFRVLTSDVAA